MIEEMKLVGSTLHVKAVGQLTFADHEAFRRVLRHMSEGELETVAFDLESLDFIDSAGLGMFLLAKDEADSRGQRIILEGVNGNVKKMLSIAQFDSMFQIR